MCVRMHDVLIRKMSDKMFDAISQSAKAELRSVNKEILILLNEALIGRIGRGNQQQE